MNMHCALTSVRTHHGHLSATKTRTRKITDHRQKFPHHGHNTAPLGKEVCDILGDVLLEVGNGVHAKGKLHSPSFEKRCCFTSLLTTPFDPSLGSNLPITALLETAALVLDHTSTPYLLRYWVAIPQSVWIRGLSPDISRLAAFELLILRHVHQRDDCCAFKWCFEMSQ
jgi:hypothetical protein